MDQHFTHDELFLIRELAESHREDVVKGTVSPCGEFEKELATDLVAKLDTYLRSNRLNRTWD